jgi:hypothetical protein
LERARIKRVAVLLLLALVVALAGTLATWLVLGGAQTDILPAGPASEINEIPLYTGALNVEERGTSPGDYAHLQYEVDAPVAEVDTFYKEALSRLGWQSDWADSVRAGSDSVNLDWRAPKYDDTLRRHFYRLSEQRDRPYDVSVYIDVSDNRVARWAAARTLVDISLSRIPQLDAVPVFPGATEIERVGNLTFYRTAATLDDLKAYYVDLLPRYGWSYVGDRTDPPTGGDLPGTLSFGYTIHGFRASLQIKAESDADGMLSVRMKASGSGLVPKT